MNDSPNPSAPPQPTIPTLLPLSLAGAALLQARRHHPEQFRTAIVLSIAAASVHGLAMAAGLATLRRQSGA